MIEIVENNFKRTATCYYGSEKPTVLEKAK